MGHPLLDLFLAIRGQLDTALGSVEEYRGGIDDRELAELLQLHKELGAKVDALGLNLTSEAVATDLPHRAGATSPAAWLGGLTKMSPHIAKDRVRTALALDSLCLDTKDALESGRIAYEHASAIASIMTDLPKGASPEQVAQAEHYLLDRAPSTNGLALRKLTKRVDDLIDPDGLLARERTAQKKCELKDRDNHDGTHTVTWTTTDERHAKWKAAVGPLAAPRPASDGTKDERTPGQRLDDAMNDLVEGTLRFGDLPTTRGHRPTVIVTISEESLRTGKGFGVTTSGETLTAAAVQRIACDADIFPLHIDGDGIPLKLGRSQRLASHGQWLALIARDGGCIGPDCTRPPEWCQAHHSDYWEHLGPTDIDKLALLCDFHHDQVHHHGWQVIFAADGHPEMVPPTHIDPFQWPIRNTYWHDLRGGEPVRRQAA